MNYTIDINCDNAAFENNQGGEVVRILYKLAGRIEGMDDLEGESIRLIDANGNCVGSAESC